MGQQGLQQARHFLGYHLGLELSLRRLAQGIHDLRAQLVERMWRSWVSLS